MGMVILVCCTLVLCTTVIHYEILLTSQTLLPRLQIPDRLKLLFVILLCFIAHALEIGLYGLALHGLIETASVGGLSGLDQHSFSTVLYFSAETYTSLGFGDITPTGPLRLLAGVEALNGLLLIGWSASFTYLCMERFWDIREQPRSSNQQPIK